MTLHERFNTLEHEARDRIHRMLATGNERLKELDEALAKVAQDDFSAPRVKRELEELRTRAETLRSNALKRAGELPGEAVHRLASGTRAPVQSLAKRLAEMAKRLESAPPPATPATPEPAEHAKTGGE